MVFLGQAANYSFGRIWQHLLAWGTKRDFDELRRQLAHRYQVKPSQVALYHTGRSAITAALQVMAPEGARVMIPGLTCIAVVRAVRAAGCEPVFVDIEPENLEYDYGELEKALKKNSECIILVQNTLGYSWQASKIEKLAQKYHAGILEDLAHSAGRVYPDGREVGLIGDAVALSFGKGKAVDTISGGAVVMRKPSQKVVQPTRRPKLSDRLRDRWYPVFGGVSRILRPAKLGQFAMGALVKLHWVQRSADAELDTTRRLTYWQAKLALRQLRRLSSEPLREFYLVNKRTEVLQKLRRHGYHLQEIWYDTPVSPARYAKEADFPSRACPKTVKIARQIINLPTWCTTAEHEQMLEIIKPYLVKPSAKSDTMAKPTKRSEA